MTDIHFLLFSNSVGGDQENTGRCDHGGHLRRPASALPKLAECRAGGGGGQRHIPPVSNETWRRPGGRVDVEFRELVAANLVEDEEILRKPLLISDAFGEL